MASGKRLETETFVQYRARLKQQALADKLFARGKLIWNSFTQGTYRK